MDNFWLKGFWILLIALCLLPTWVQGRVRIKGASSYALDFSLHMAMGLMALGYFIGPSGKKFCIRLCGFSLLSLLIKDADNKSSEQETSATYKKKGKETLKYIWQRRDKIQQEVHLLKKNFFLERLIGRLYFGFSDPATTGEVYGYFCSLLILSSKKIRFYAQANFMEPCFEARLWGRAFFIPLFLVLSLGIALLRICWNDQPRFIFKARSVS